MSADPLPVLPHLPHRPQVWRRALCRAATLALAVWVASATAADGPADVMAGMVLTGTVLTDRAVTSVTTSVMPATSLLARPALDGAMASSVSTQTMLWAGSAGLSLGLGIEQRAAPLLPRPPGSLATGDAGLLIGLGLDAGSRTRLTWQTPLLRPDVGNSAGAPRQMRMGLVFSLRDPYADLRRGMLTRVELSGQTALALRTRGGRIGLTLTSKW